MTLRAGVGIVLVAAALATSAAYAQPVHPEPTTSLSFRLAPTPGQNLGDVAMAYRDTTIKPPDPWLGADKAIHAGGSFLMTLSGQYILTDKTELSNAQALPFAAGAALAIGLTKEILDSQRPVRPHFSWRDLAADALGVALGVAVVSL